MAASFRAVLAAAFLIVATTTIAWAAPIPLGGMCLTAKDDPGSVSTWPTRDATCAGGPKKAGCYPGPADPGQGGSGPYDSVGGGGGGGRTNWYCTKIEKNCAYPGKAGVMDGESIGADLCVCDKKKIGDAGGRCQGLAPVSVAPGQGPVAPRGCEPNCTPANNAGKCTGSGCTKVP